MRETMPDGLRSDQFDVLIIGGSTTGGGMALDAAARGLRTGLVGRYDFAEGPGSRGNNPAHIVSVVCSILEERGDLEDSRLRQGNC